MDAIEFVSRYQDYLSQLEKVVKPELLPAPPKLKDTDPHDLVSTECYFNSETEAGGMVFKLFLRQIQRDRINEEYPISILSSLPDATNFSIVSAWHDGKAVDSNRIAHRQLEDNLKNLGY